MNRQDLPLLSLLAANGVTILLALLQDWNLSTVLGVYWFQSVAIGFFTLVRLLAVPAGDGGLSRLPSLLLAAFFAVHYGLFHLVYLVFLTGFFLAGSIGDVDVPGITLGCAVFLVNHLVSFLWYRPREEAAPAAIFAEPYARILPMHLTIIGGGFASAMLPGAAGTRLVLLLFLLLKTGVDVAAHLKKHAGAAPGAAPPATRPAPSPVPVKSEE